LAGTWQEALLLLHRRGWHGELVDEACERLIEACLEGELAGRPTGDLTQHEIARVLGQSPTEEEARALARVSEVHDRTDPDGHALRDALGDLDAFAEALPERG